MTVSSRAATGGPVAVPVGSLGAGGSASDLLERVHLLGAARSRPVQAAAVAAGAVLLVAVPTLAVVLPWLADLRVW